MGYSGAVASEDSSGRRRRRGGDHQDGQRASAAHGHRGGLGLSSSAGESARRSASARQAPERGGARRSRGRRSTACTRATVRSSAQGQCTQQVVTAVGRELLGFIWAIGVDGGTPKRRRVKSARGVTEQERDERSNGRGREAHGKENPRRLLCGGPLGSTRAASPRQLPTDHDYDGGASGSIREYQSDQPSYAPPRLLPGLPQQWDATMRRRTLDLTGRSISVS